MSDTARPSPDPAHAAEARRIVEGCEHGTKPLYQRKQGACADCIAAALAARPSPERGVGEAPLTQQPIEHVDATPDEGYPLRILEAYRANCDVQWEVHGLPEDRSRIYDLMNEACEKRAAILDRAIAKLRARLEARPR